ncbi:uncharacterized protein LOC112453440 [Temnothorax curvispinosus]|uniref:Uncharacterized protein LOC112453440 n=1 Tax=Temnothorax curvispinosus TaxID=300111 RepID=A0A6J1PKV2_9HYME|nr:uncharacterized protein LOC112453440 [Temnothorax curvispinosus]
MDAEPRTSKDCDYCEKENIPAILNGELFVIKNIDNNKVMAQCKVCNAKRKKTMIKGALNAQLIFVHKLHPTEFNKFTEMSIKSYPNRKKRKVANDDKSAPTISTNIDVGSSCVKQKQLKISEVKIPSNKQKQTLFDKNVMNYIVKSMKPLNTVDDPNFIDLCRGLDSSIIVMSRRTLSRKIEEDRISVTEQLLQVFQNVKFICSTADIWSTKHRSFMGVTAHWIDENTLQRHSAVLACKRFKGTHNYISIANLLFEINMQYNLKSKQIVSTVTDNGSNFVKAFKEFGYKIKIPTMLEEEIPTVLEKEEEGEIDSEYCSNEEDLDEYVDELDTDFEFRNINQEQEDTNIQPIIELSKHLRCASHTLSLVATTDFTKALKQNSVASKIHHTAMGKCTMLWNMSRRPKTSEKIVDFLGKSLKYPTPTRWNSLFDALSDLLVHREKLNKLMPKLDSNVLFKDVELNYLEECIAVLSPIASALDRLQSENECYYSILMPTLFSLKLRMKMLHKKNLRFLDSVVAIFITSLEKIFEDFFNFSPKVNDAIIASCLHPAFKLKWLPKTMSSEKVLGF